MQIKVVRDDFEFSVNRENDPLRESPSRTTFIASKHLHSKSPTMRKAIRRYLPKDAVAYQAKQREQQYTERFVENLPDGLQCPVDRILGNQAMVQLLSLKLESEGEEATVTFLESLGCSDVRKVMRTIACM